MSASRPLPHLLLALTCLAMGRPAAADPLTDLLTPLPSAAAAPRQDLLGPGSAPHALIAPDSPAMREVIARDLERIASSQFVGTTPTWSLESNVANRFMGRSAVTAGDVNGDGFSDIVALGGLSASDFLYLFLGSASGPALAPGFPVTLPSSGGGTLGPAGDLNGDGFADVAYSLPTASGGALRVFYGSASGLGTASPFTLTVTFSNFWGQVVGPAGDVNGDGYDDLAIGSPSTGPNVSLCGSSGSGQGRVDVLYGSPSGVTALNWTLWGCQWVASAGGMGSSVGTAGDVNSDGYDDLVVGAPGHVHSSLGSAAGAIWVVYGAAGGLPLVNGFTNLGSLTGATRIESPAVFATFGASACTAGDVNGDGFADVAVGAPYDDSFANDGGIARVYAGSASGLTSTVLWFEGLGSANGRFGTTLAPAGDINADGKGDLLVGSVGSLHVAQSTGTTLLLQRTYSTPGSSDLSGCATAGDVNGDGISDLVVAETQFTGPESFEGRVRVFAGRGDGPSLFSNWNTGTSFEDPNYGWSVASAGDVNGDGLDDVLVGAPNWDNFSNPGESDNGLVLLYLGSLSGLPTSYSWFYFGAPNDNVGISVSGLGDVNNDGYADFGVGAHQPFSGFGKALVFFGGPSLPSTPSQTVTGPSNFSRFGSAVSGGDFNGDGYADMAVGAPYDDPGGINDAGSARVHLGGPAGLSLGHAWQGSGTQVDEHYGSSLNGFADINADGYTDLVVGSPGYDRPVGFGSLVDQGRVFEYRGIAGAGALTFVKTLPGQINESFGYSVSNAGDVDGDGYGDIIVGGPFNNQTISGQGRAAVHRGSPSGLIATAHWSQLGYEAFSSFGSAVSGAGDVDGDGLSDVLVGAVFEDAGGAQDRGSARVFTGPLPNGAAAYWTAYGPSSFANLGHALANAGDIDGDGWPEIIAGEPGYTQVAFRQGRADVYMGARDDSRINLNVARRFSNSSVIVPMGSAANNTAYLLGYTPSAAGRTRYKSVWQAQVPAAYGSINSSGQSAAWTSTLDFGAAFGQLTLMNAPVAVQNGTPYWWRYRSLSRSIHFPSSRWISPTRSGVREYDLRGPGTTWVGVDDPVTLPSALALAAPRPNPMRGAGAVLFSLPRESDVSLEVVDVQGRVLRTLVSGLRGAGEHRATWDGADAEGREAAAGVYFYRLRAGGETLSRKFVRVD